MKILIKYIPVTYRAGWSFNGVWALKVILPQGSMYALYNAKPTARQMRQAVKRCKRMHRGTYL